MCPNRAWKPPRMDLVQPFRDNSSTESLPESVAVSSCLRDMVHVSAMKLSNCFQSSHHIWHSQAWNSSSHCFFISHAFMLLFLLRTLVFPTPCLCYKDQSTVLLHSSPNLGWLCLLNSPGLHQFAHGFLECSIQKWIPRSPSQCPMVCLDCSKSVWLRWEGNKKC